MKNIIKDITVDAWYNSPSCTTSGKPVSRISKLSQDSFYTYHIKPICGDSLLQDVTEEELADLLQDLHDSGYSFGTVFGTYAVITRIFRSAFMAHVIDQYPCENLHQMIVQWNSYSYNC